MEAELATLLSSSMFGTDAVDVLRGGDELQSVNAWPERYLLSLQRVPSRDNQARVELQVVNASDLRLVYVTSLEFNMSDAGRIDATSLETIDTLARSLVNETGPVISDYQQHYIPAE